MAGINIILVFLIAHVLGDFYLQTDNIAKEKNEKYSSLFIHAAIYAVITIGLALLVSGTALLATSIVLSVLHFIVDLIKRYFDKKGKLSKSTLFFSDQVIHLILIVVVSFFMTYQHQITNPSGPLWDSDFAVTLTTVLKVLLVIKPASIAIKLLLEKFRPNISEQDGIENAGAWIGILERLILLVFLSLQQYGAVGFVLTAKSIARYDKITKDGQFAEYYLLGTLLSSLIVIAVSLI